MRWLTASRLHTAALLTFVVAVVASAWGQAKRPESRPKARTITEYVVDEDVVEFDAYWRDACLTLAAALQPIADIAEQPMRPNSVDDRKRHDAAVQVARDVDELRENANAKRRIRILWVAVSEKECQPVFVSEKLGLAIEKGERYTIATGRGTPDCGLMTRLLPHADPSVGSTADPLGEAARIKGLWIPAELEVCHSLSKPAKDKRGMERGRSKDVFERAFVEAPEWNEGPDAMRGVTVEIEPRPTGGPSALATTPEVTVRLTPPRFVDTISRIEFDLFERSADGGRGAKVNGDARLVAWGYGGRPALRHVPVKALCAHGYDVEMVTARYR